MDLRDQRIRFPSLLRDILYQGVDRSNSAMEYQDSCLACDLMSGRAALPGGVIDETDQWMVEHCVGPLGIGTLIVKPKRHVVHVRDLNGAQAHSLPLLRRVTGAVAEVLGATRSMSACGRMRAGSPVHIHWLVQPATDTNDANARGPHLQVAMFGRGENPPVSSVEAVAVPTAIQALGSERLSARFTAREAGRSQKVMRGEIVVAWSWWNCEQTVPKGRSYSELSTCLRPGSRSPP